MIRWSPDQLKAITKIGSNMLLSAAAGSGKTSVLTERVIRLMEGEGLDVDRFLIFTFTRAAAANMKEKIHQKIVDGIGDPVKGAFFSRQLLLVNQANIMTIHAFCSQIIRENFYVLGIDPGFSIFEENEERTVKQDVIERLFETRYRERDPAFLKLVEAYADERDDRKLAALILELDDKRSQHADFEGWLTVLFQELEDPDLWEERLKTMIAETLTHAIDLCAQAGSWIRTGEERLVPFFEEEQRALEALKKRSMESLDDFSMNFRRLTWPKDADPELKQQVNAVRKIYKDRVSTIEKRYFGEIPLEEHHRMFGEQLPRVKDLVALLEDFEQALMVYKQRYNTLGYNDLEHFALALLEREEIAARYREQFAYLFVDEYQDSSDIQEAIIQRLVRKDNLFMVGDLKQSIYRFRSALPEIFAGKYQAFSRDEAALDFKMDLNRNFRSRGNVLAFINQIFAPLLTVDFGGMDYDQRTRLHQGNTGFEGTDPEVEIHLVRNGHPQLSKAELEIHEMVGRIRSLHEEEGVPYSDIVVIMRSPTSYLESFVDIFRIHGVPFISNRTYAFARTLEVQQLMNFLRVIDNPRQDIPLASLMRSPVFGFTDGDLARIRQTDRRKAFHENVLGSAAGQRTAHLKETLSRYRQIGSHLKVSELIWRIYSEEGYRNYFLGLPDGDQREANVQLLVEVAADFERSRHASLRRFIDHFERLEEAGRMEGVQLGVEHAEAVRLLTIHGSKGLEFPVVVLAGLDKHFNDQDASGDLVYHRKLGLLSRFIDPVRRVKFTTFHRDLVQEQMRLEMREEEMRLLYTAMTRAQERLLLFAGVKDDRFDERLGRWQERIDLQGRKQTNTYLDWIMGSLYAHQPREHSSWRLEVVETRTRDYPRDTRGERVTTPEALIRHLPMPDGREWLEKPLPAWRLGPSKVSVTAIAHQQIDRIDQMALKFYTSPQQKGPLSATELGTQIHKLIQLLRLDGVDSHQALLAQVEKLKHQQMIHPELDRLFDLKMIQAFFDSDLGRRLRRSDEVYRERAFVLKAATDGMPGPSLSEDVMVQGIIDCYFIEEGEAVLIDFKSDHVTEATFAHAVPKYTVQLDYYARAIERLSGRRVKERYIHFIRTNQSHRVD